VIARLSPGPGRPPGCLDTPHDPRRHRRSSRPLRAPIGALILAAATAVAIASGPPAAKPETRRPILITVDDLPVASGALHTDPAERERITRDLLAALDRHHIKAVGLVIWKNVGEGKAGPDLLDLWLKRGHELGNHSFDHPDYSVTDEAVYIADVERGRRGLADFLDARGAKPRFFRFPYLDEGDTARKLEAMRRYLGTSGQRNLPVTIDTQDWSFEESWIAARRAGDRSARAEVAADYLAALRLEVRSHERHGDRLFGRPTPQVILLHANEIGAALWSDLFDWLEKTGHRFATADEVLADPAFSEEHRFVGRQGCGLWDRLQHERSERAARRAIEDLLVRQTEAWNRGDIETFCSIYADDAAFLSPAGMTTGRQAVIDRYRARYPDQAAMGHLALEILEASPIWGMETDLLLNAVPGDMQGMTIAARWSLTYPGKASATGLTLLILRPRGEGWAIVQDASM
jgi:peptidoglycan-N-acetylglucosamine deacetylase